MRPFGVRKLLLLVGIVGMNEQKDDVLLAKIRKVERNAKGK